jgi:hypothetical protein
MARIADHGPQDVHARIAALDVGLFKDIKSQTKAGDRASLLALEGGCAERFGTFSYLEIGSHLGGSLQPFVRDDRVTSIVSIDLRPEVTPDERGKGIPYQGNSTQRMLDNLAGLAHADLGKIHTIDADSRSLGPADVPGRPELAFIDGEHTNESCLADARFCRSVAAPKAVIAFHDAPIIHRAIWAFIAELRADGEDVVAYPLPDRVFVVEVGGPRVYATRAMRALTRAERFPAPDPVAALLARRPVGGVARWALLNAWLTPVGAGRPYLERSLRRRRKQAGKAAKRRRRRAIKHLRKRLPR